MDINIPIFYSNGTVHECAELNEPTLTSSRVWSGRLSTEVVELV